MYQTRTHNGFCSTAWSNLNRCYSNYPACTPSCNLITSVVSASMGESISFQVNAQVLGTGTHRFEFDFGDGSPYKYCDIVGASGSCSVTHTYTAAGTYLVDTHVKVPSVQCDANIEITAAAINPPTDPGVGLSPADPQIDDDLVCSVSAESTDPDLGDTITYEYAWYKNGVKVDALTLSGTTQLSYSLSSAFTSEGDQWRCSVTAIDSSTLRSNEVSSSTVTVSAVLQDCGEIAPEKWHQATGVQDPNCINNPYNFFADGRIDPSTVCVADTNDNSLFDVQCDKSAAPYKIRPINQ